MVLVFSAVYEFSVLKHMVFTLVKTLMGFRIWYLMWFSVLPIWVLVSLQLGCENLSVLKVLHVVFSFDPIFNFQTLDLIKDLESELTCSLKFVSFSLKFVDQYVFQLEYI